MQYVREGTEYSSNINSDVTGRYMMNPCKVEVRKRDLRPLECNGLHNRSVMSMG